MKRKQFSLTDRHTAMLSSLSEFLQVSESEILRRVLDRQLPAEMSAHGLRKADISDIDLNKEEFTREEIDRIMAADGRPWVSGLKE